jgi:hypothetical protein
MAEWEGGDFLGKEDSACLLEAAKQGLTLITYDRRTIRPLPKLRAEEQRSHGGVIFVDERQFPRERRISLGEELIRGIASDVLRDVLRRLSPRKRYFADRFRRNWRGEVKVDL